MVRKNIHVDDLIARGVAQVRHAGNMRSETAAYNRLLEGAVEEVKERTGYVYLAYSHPSDLLKIGYSKQPDIRMRALKRDEGGEVELLRTLAGSRLLEIAAHITWSKRWIRGEWFQNCKEIRDWFDNHPQRYDEPDNLARHIRVPVLLTEAEHEMLLAAAERHGIGKSALLRMAAFGSALIREAAKKGDGDAD